MNYDWYFVINKNEFLDTGLVSKSIDMTLEGIGLKTVLVTLGNYVGITYEGIFLALNMVDKNPYEFDDHAIYVDANNDIWLGILNDD